MPHPLVDTWLQAHRDFRDAAGRTPWHHPTLLPGWSVADVVAHTVWIERTALGLQDPPHEPDWPSLTHIESDFGRATEVPVDLRRSWPEERVMAELDEAVAARHELLLATDPAATARNIFGQERPLADVLTDRIFDLWVHEQDIRAAGGDPGHLATQPAVVASGVLIRGLGYIWAKRAEAPVGTTLLVTATPPGLSFTAAVQRQPDGRARPVDPPAAPTVSLRMPFEQFVAHTCGRRNADHGLVVIEGESALGRRVVERFAITP